MTKTFSPFFAVLLVVLWMVLVAVERVSAAEAPSQTCHASVSLDGR
ncbi:MAG: hypothetical protein WBN65_10225 [Gammaproteobacteria bacterium]